MAIEIPVRKCGSECHHFVDYGPPSISVNYQYQCEVNPPTDFFTSPGKDCYFGFAPTDPKNPNVDIVVKLKPCPFLKELSQVKSRLETLSHN